MVGPGTVMWDLERCAVLRFGEVRYDWVIDGGD